jgi:hypothetical protein
VLLVLVLLVLSAPTTRDSPPEDISSPDNVAIGLLVPMPTLPELSMRSLSVDEVVIATVLAAGDASLVVPVNDEGTLLNGIIDYP